MERPCALEFRRHLTGKYKPNRTPDRATEEQSRCRPASRSTPAVGCAPRPPAQMRLLVSLAPERARTLFRLERQRASIPRFGKDEGAKMRSACHPVTMPGLYRLQKK